MKQSLLFLTALVASLAFAPLAAQTIVEIDGVPVKQHHVGERLYHTATDYLDSLAMKHIDPRYIEVPQQPWRVMATGNLNEMSLHLDAERQDEFIERMSGDFSATTGIDFSSGVRVGYRTLALGYMVKWGHLNGSSFSFGTNGNRFGLNVKLRRFKTQEVKLHDYITGIMDTVITHSLASPVRIKSLMIDGYYVFNNRHYSNGATHALAFIQKRSAGSIIVGASYVNAEVDYATDANWLFIGGAMNGIGRIRMQQINLSAGYGYNWVPTRGLVVNLTLMPQISLDNRLTTWAYQTVYTDPVVTEDTFIPGEAIGITPNGKDNTHSRLRLTWTGRAAVVYNHRRWVAAATAQWQQYRYGHTGPRTVNSFDPETGEPRQYSWKVKTTGRLTDWTANLSLGYRF